MSLVSVFQDEESSVGGGGDGCKTGVMCLMPLNCPFNSG